MVHTGVRIVNPIFNVYNLFFMMYLFIYISISSEAYMKESEFLARALAGDIMLNATMPGTVGFVKPVNQQNFQSLVVDVCYQSPEGAQEMLEGALRALSGDADEAGGSADEVILLRRIELDWK